MTGSSPFLPLPSAADMTSTATSITSKPQDAVADPQSANTNKLRKRLTRNVAQANIDFNMIEEGDKVLVCCSGGKDSYTLLTILADLAERAPINFDIVAMNLDQKQPGFPDTVLPAYFEQTGLPYRIVTEDTYAIVKDKIQAGKTTCSLCSRLRRGIIYRTARELGCNKIALGHHRHDILETFFLNLFFAGRLKAMPPKLKTDTGDLVLVRPLAYCAEKDIARFARAMAYPIIPCNLCGSQENLQRQNIKAMLQDWEKAYPGRADIMFKALQTLVPSHLMDHRHFEFASLRADLEGGWDFGAESSDPALGQAGMAAFLQQWLPQEPNSL